MLRSVFLKTLRDERLQILAWGVGLAAAGAAVVLTFPSIQGAPELKELLKLLPKPFQALVGDPTLFNALEGFLELKLFGALPLLLGVFAIAHGAGAIAGEEERGTLELVLASPLPRWRLVVEKFAGLAVGLVAICACMAIGLSVAISVSKLEVSKADLTVASFNVIPLALVFGGIALLGSCVFRRPRSAGLVAGAVALTSWFLELLGPLQGGGPWERLSLFHYYRRSQPLGRPPESEFTLLLLVLALLLLLGAVMAFRRRDVAT